ncbi:hypothetical protein [Kangiella shandongensis]|uniref:hypothetical protein n=1 Tax=Kangiella shandongensis TaxID=2763258 RepID=UPI001CBAA1E2|nr:hypothetical protein [Kangiella shandongensis]
MSATCGVARSPDAGLNNQPISTTYPCDFDLDVELSGQRDVLTPLAVPSFNGDVTFSSVGFNVGIENCKADSLDVEVIHEGNVIYNESLSGEFLNRGTHLWEWDGYDNNQILDTKVLKSDALKIVFIGTKNGIDKKRTIEFDNDAEEVDWLDVRIDKNSGSAEVTLRPSFSDDGIDGTPPQGVTVVSYDYVKQLAKQGIEKYWSRTGSRAVNSPEGKFDVRVKVEFAEPSASDFDLERNYDTDFGRSTSFWVFKSIIYNYGFHYRRNARLGLGVVKQEADENFKETAAHEIGHLILNNYGGRFGYSWSHKDSSTVLTQSTLDNQNLPSSGEIDLMKYYEYHTDPVRNGNRIIAAEVDVLSLFWLTSVEFGN